jgi:amino acid adenylation domain-containing protein
MVLHAGFAALLTRLGAGHDIAVGSPVAGRSHRALEDLVGLFVNSIVIRTDTSGNPSFINLVRQVREACLGAYTHQDLPFEVLVEHLNPKRSVAHAPIFQIVLALQNAGQARLDLPGVTTGVAFAARAAAHLDLFLSLTEQYDETGAPVGIGGVAEYATDLFDRETIVSVIARWTSLLETLVAEPERPIAVDLLTADERHGLTEKWRTRSSQVRPVTIPDLFEAQVSRTPHGLALVDGVVQVAYADLDALARQLAQRLGIQGVRPEQVVGALLPRSTELIVAFLGIVKSGAAYLPLDPGYPDERLAYILADAAPTLVLTTSALVHRLPSTVPRLLVDVDEEPSAGCVADVRPTPHNLAYVVYTSGTTGRPKGVLLSHEGAADLAAQLQETIAIEPGHRVLQLVSPSFDASLWDILGALLSGGTLVLAPPGGLSGQDLIRFAAELELTHLTVPPPILAELRPGSLAAGTTITVSGDVCTARLAAVWAGKYRFFNGYGPTEVTVGATMHECTSECAHDIVPIGQPFRGKRVYVLDERLRLVPPGVFGELYIAGSGLARGYLGQAAQTATRFLADPFGDPGSRMYRTGDLGRWNLHGELEFAGRVDSQVKFRGFRVELGEIESVLAEHPRISHSAVVVRADAGGVARLVAYVVPDGSDAGRDDTAGEMAGMDVRTFAAARLPEYMVPAAVVPLPRLPLTRNGKLDQEALPVPVWQVTGRSPRTPRETVLCDLFAEVLGIDAVGTEDNFFDLGGHSLLAARLVERIRAVLGVDVSVQALFGASTVAGLANRLSGQDGADSALASTLLLRPEGRFAPLFAIPPVTGLSWTYAGLLHHVSADFPIIGLQSPGLSDPGDFPQSIAELVDYYAHTVDRMQREGSLSLLGWSFGGMVAHALATELRSRGREVALLALLDASPAEPARWAEAGITPEVSDEAAYLQLLEAFGVAIPREMGPRLTSEQFLILARGSSGVLASLDDAEIIRIIDVMRANRRIIAGFTQRSIEVPTVLFSASDGVDCAVSRAMWQPYVGSKLDVYNVNSTHLGMTSPASLSYIGPLLEQHLRQELQKPGCGRNK